MPDTDNDRIGTFLKVVELAIDQLCPAIEEYSHTLNKERLAEDEHIRQQMKQRQKMK